MYIISSASAPLLGTHVKPVVQQVAGAKATFLNYEAENGLPSIPSGSVVLVMGNRVLQEMQAQGMLPKNRVVSSLREKEFFLSGSSWFITYDPFLITTDYSKKCIVTWDIKLALRRELTGTTEPDVGSYSFVENFDKMAAEIKGEYEETGKPIVVCCDTETIGLNPYPEDKWIESIQFSNREGVGYCLRFRSAENQPTQPLPGGGKNTPNNLLWEQLDWILNTDMVKIVGANFKYDMRWMAQKWDMDCTNFVFDTTLVGSLIDENRSNSLETHTKIYTTMGGYDGTMNEKYDKSRMDLIPDEDFLTYSAGDVDACLRVYHKLRQEILDIPFLARFYVKLLHRSSRTFLDMELVGVRLDKDCQDKLEQELIETRQGLEEEMISKLPVKLRLKHADQLDLRPKVLKDYFFGARGLNLTPKLFTEKTKQPSTAMEHFMMFDKEPKAKLFVERLKKFGSASKTLSTYIIGFNKHLQPDGRFHASYMLHKGDYNGAGGSGTDTGRTSAKDPAVQCIPRWVQVLTTEGYVAVLDIVQGYEAGKTTKVLTHDGSWRDVIGVYRNGIRPLWQITLESGHTITCTENHPLLTSEGFVRADNIGVGVACYVIDRGGSREIIGVGKSAGMVFDREIGLEQELPLGELSLGPPPTAKQKQEKHRAADVQRHNQGAGGLGGGYGATPECVGVAGAERVEGGSGTHHAKEAERAGYTPSKIVDISLVAPEETFDLTIEGSHSFVANGVVVHNTIPKHTIWTKPLRKAYIAPEGRVILSCDYAAGELRVAADLANETNMITAFNKGVDVHCLTAAYLLGMNMDAFMALKNTDPTRYKAARQGAKAGNFGCLFELQYCNTDKGRIQLRDITKDHKVWDGDNWVAHDGIIYQGEQWVMEYQGLTATPCHKVWVIYGNTTKKVTIYDAAIKGCKLRESGRTTSQTKYGNLGVRPDYGEDRREASQGVRDMHRLQKSAGVVHHEHPEWEDYQLPMPEELEKQRHTPSKGLGSKVRLYGAALRKRYAQAIARLQRSWNQVLVQVEAGICGMGFEVSLQGQLQGVGVRQDRQRWSLRTRQFEVRDFQREQEEFAQQRVSGLPRGEDVLAGFQEPVQPPQNAGVRESRHDGGGYYPPCKEVSAEKVQELARHGITLRRARVYDILNAGPNHRFTCAGVLVSNCLYGMSAGGYQAYAEASYGVVLSSKEAAEHRASFFELYPALPAWHTRYKQFAKLHGYVKSPLGRIRRLPLITSSDSSIRSKAERNAINSPVQGCLSDLTQLSLIMLREEYGFKELQPMMMVHDDLKFYVPAGDAEVWAQRVCHTMSHLPLKELFGWEPKLTFKADAEVGPTLADMEEI